ncbi:restriction endonuclease subunit S [Flavobacterium sp. Arc3]|uniref:restriction endonuclease subunit S n=1 Tax=Flavobacterium sp. Arc3 TaxID=3046686 RepID=UPI00352FE08B
MSNLNNNLSQNDIPDTWSRIPLYEFRNKNDRYGFTGGPFGSDLKSEHYTQSGVKILQLQNIGEGKFIDKGIVYTSEEKANELISCNIYPDEIILAKMAPVARCCKVPSTDERYVMCSDGIRLSVDTNKYDNDFVFQALNSKYFRDEAESKSTGTTRARIGLNELKQICLAVPNSLPEQQKIAKILSAVDDKIEVIDQQIIETQALKKGLMQRLLTKGIGHTEFKDSPLGMIPKSWEVVTINEIAEVKGGKRLPKGEALIENKTEHPYIRVTDMFMGGVSLEKILYVPDNIFPVISRYTISKDDLFISVAGTLGIVGEVPFELDGANLTENADKLTNIKVNKSFLLQLLLSPFIQDLVQKEQTNNAQPKLALTRIKEFIIPKPPKEEQEKIASILRTVDNKLEVLLEKKTHYQELKQGLMQQLLTGRIRVTI